MHDLVVRDLEKATNRTLGLTHDGVAERSVLNPHPHAESASDSAQPAARLFDFGPERAGEFVRDLAKRDPDARLNLLLAIIATRRNNTLSIPRRGGGVVVASEPCDDDSGWRTSPISPRRRGPRRGDLTDLEA
jgi:gamma-glutamyl hercynylcysteine S-oxide hydrolase